MRVWLLAAAVILAGCAEPEPPATPEEDPDVPPLQGWVFDPTLKALAGASVELIQTGEVVATDAEGHYVFEEVPRDISVIIVVKLDEFESGSKEVLLFANQKMVLNFTLVPVPVIEPYHTVTPFNGFIACQVVFATEDNDTSYDCPVGESEVVFEWLAEADLAGAVIEVAWTADSEFSDSFHAKLETLGKGDLNTVLDEQVGQSILKLGISEGQAAQYYPEGGKMRLTVRVLPNIDEEEASAGIGAAINQQFEVFASQFYHAPPPGTYTIADA